MTVLAWLAVSRVAAVVGLVIYGLLLAGFVVKQQWVLAAVGVGLMAHLWHSLRSWYAEDTQR